MSATKPTAYPGPATTMITLATLAATGATQRPSGESLVEQLQRIQTGIATQLADTSLATGGDWQPMWWGLTQDRANFAYITQNTQQNSLAISVRGTLFSSLIDLGEDLNVGSLAEFTATNVPGQQYPILVSSGAMQAFTEIINATYPLGDSSLENTNMVQAVNTLLSGLQPNPTLYITGHSLGGAMATMLAMYLMTCQWKNTPTYMVYTYAAPTAGLQTFADAYDQVLTNKSPNQTWRFYNVWDAVPNAWATLNKVYSTFYPASTGPTQTADVKFLLDLVESLPGNNLYVQTNQNNVNAIQLNTAAYGTAGTYDSNYTGPTTDDFMGQVGWQHNSYMAFMGAPPLAGSAPTITGITPNSGSADGDVSVTITGTGFGPYNEYLTFVDFGTQSSPKFTINSDTSITATAPPLAGTVDVRVTTMYGTSPVTPYDQYTAPPPAVFAPYAASINPNNGSKNGGTPVTIPGGAFTPDCTVTIGGVAATDVVVLSQTKITAVTPAGSPGSVPVVVTNSSKVSSTQPVEYQYNKL